MRAHRLQHLHRQLAHLENVANVARQTRRIAHKEPGRFPTNKRNEGPKFRQEVVRWLQECAQKGRQIRLHHLQQEPQAQAETRLIERREERLYCTTTGIPFSAYLVVAFQMDHYDFFSPHLDLYTVPCYAVTTENTHDNASDIVHQCSRSVVYLSLL